MSAKKISAYRQQPEPSSNTSTYVLGAIAVLVTAAVVVAMVIWQSNTSDEVREDGYGTARNAPVTVAEDNAIVLGQPDAPVTVELFADFMCPACASFESIYGQEIAKNLDSGAVAVRHRFIDFLNQTSASGDYSTRAAASAYCVAETGDGAAFASYTHQLFSSGTQPSEGGSEDLSNEQLAQIARDNGVNDSGAQCIATGAQVERAATAATAGKETLGALLGGVRTPTVLHNGQSLDINNKTWLADLVG